MTKAAPIVLVTLLGLATVAAAGDRSALPVVFDSELVVLEIESDSLRVDGTYVLLCRPDAAGTPVSLVYPYPQDPELGGARTVSLACRLGAGSWRQLAVHELPGGRGALWSLPVAAGDTLEVRTTYRQALRTAYARYIVTTTAAWGRPLRSARFEIHLPPGVVAEEFSFPFEPCDRGGRDCWCYEATDFLPDRDVTVRWRRP
ncbi:MAG TPA: hypothetical protein PLL30_00205 [Candidatus Krumholzibacteria bacterium]|nr:hypothetical protein [Candidatus Krumholzibacteria bacterium]HPD70180.1 hypothetical protein [Candidatus Krumholzibacteria bacterium]HRY40120.1 hypothetical protein [Candidatus Krumholzibacteria bacterium]